MKRLTLLLFVTLSILSGDSFAKDRELFGVTSNPHPEALLTRFHKDFPKIASWK